MESQYQCFINFLLKFLYDGNNFCQRTNKEFTNKKVIIKNDNSLMWV